jgi:hypothetical protein
MTDQTAMVLSNRTLLSNLMPLSNRMPLSNLMPFSNRSAEPVEVRLSVKHMQAQLRATDIPNAALTITFGGILVTVRYLTINHAADFTPHSVYQHACFCNV